MRIVKLIVIVLLIALGYLLFAPTPVRPVAWQPALAPSWTEGPYARNTRLQGIERIAAIGSRGPESLAFADDGTFYSGLADGSVVHYAADGRNAQIVVNTGGRPLGLALHPNGDLIVADAKRGLLRIDNNGQLNVLSTAAGGVPFAFPDSVAVDRAGRYAYFSDASSRYGLNQVALDIVEHGARGRLLRYDFSNGRSEVLLSGLQFANGVALGPDERYVVVNETGAYRVTRYWLQGEHAGTADVFIDNLPGLPDNITYNGHGRFWLALYAPRDPLIDRLAAQPPLRKMIARLLALGDFPLKHAALAMAYDDDGHLLANLQDWGAGTYAPMTEAHEAGDWVYFGSLTQPAVGRLPLQRLLPPVSPAAP